VEVLTRKGSDSAGFDVRIQIIGMETDAVTLSMRTTFTRSMPVIVYKLFTFPLSLATPCPRVI
jgi:hypothetical protein